MDPIQNRALSRSVQLEAVYLEALLYRYFEDFDFLGQFSKKQNMIKKNYQLNRIKKFVDKARKCFAFLHIKPKFKFAVLEWSWFKVSVFKLIPWNVVRQSHLYRIGRHLQFCTSIPRFYSLSYFIMWKNLIWICWRHLHLPFHIILHISLYDSW